MKKYKHFIFAALISLLVTTIYLPLTVHAGARLGQQGYAVKDDNAMKEIQAIKASLRAMERDIRELQARQPAIDPVKYDARMAALEKQLGDLWKWLIVLAILVVILLINVITLDVAITSKKKE